MRRSQSDPRKINGTSQDATLVLVIYNHTDRRTLSDTSAVCMLQTPNMRLQQNFWTSLTKNVRTYNQAMKS